MKRFRIWVVALLLAGIAFGCTSSVEDTADRGCFFTGDIFPTDLRINKAILFGELETVQGEGAEATVMGSNPFFCFEHIPEDDAYHVEIYQIYEKLSERENSYQRLYKKQYKVTKNDRGSIDSEPLKGNDLTFPIGTVTYIEFGAYAYFFNTGNTTYVELLYSRK